ncbi:MAG: outer membrane lipid asymmetry maintenance protein MlaD [Nitrospirae bacterium]|jgi:phospholipid/cholesterol/gamma-HCH transport system substrate-binding protein|nr:outer membrane lipid asymmetry maintenance protein MlaD [Nitrospirota bacterium]MCL5061838.1 outer membrane lipid asymmetry maintenance protein MlaD [Nitrospirota bacterium]MDA8215153.1 outer membrane lipid asymmetry maintenance protein MlaD [Nitrospiraceae bacterium]MDA8338265.1 outer membrane lipid asymmetry maintenance protein MlaD [Nitrospiraceae bacterium]
MKKFDLELAVGLFVLMGILALGYISIKLGKLEVIGGGGYTVYAEFEKAGGIKSGSIVEIAGVEVGKVKSIRLNDYQALVELTIYKDVKIQEDAIASIKTKGLIGEKYVQIAPGGSEKIIPNGGRIRETESAVDLEELISKYVFGEV